MKRREEGAVAVIVALVLLVFIAAVALAVDVGGLMLHRRGLVNSSDAAALSAARTCARGGFDDHGSTEDAADTAALANSLITDAEAHGVPNVIPSLSTTCGNTSGHVTVGYTSQQSLFFAPVLGFDNRSPVHTEATASWGLGSNNPIPLVLSGQLASSCPKPPPTGANTVGQAPCGTWYDNDTLNNGNFGFLSLKPEGWNVPANSNCSGGNAGSSEIGDWVSGAQPISVSLNWTDPTYVCNIGGFKGQSHPWNELETLASVDAVRDFPITWEGPGSPGSGAPPQGSLPTGGKIEKYDVIGFAALKIIDVFRSQEAQGDPARDYTCDGKVKNNTSIPGTPAGSFYSWADLASRINGGSCQLPPSTPDSVTSVTLDSFVSPADFTFTTSGVTLFKTLVAKAPVNFVLHKNATPGPCGPAPSDSSAKCVVTQWLGSTVTGDYPTDQLDNIRVVRLCDLAQGTCLDQ
jgi:putative Flp pilus-assembly TadE/G-like protein